MMIKQKSWFFPAILLVFMVLNDSFSQDTEISRFNRYRSDVNRTGMLILGAWALGNLGVNGALYPGSSGYRRYFFQMNMAWNVVNLGIAGFGLHSALNPDTALGLTSSLSQQENIEKILLLNAGLDVAYVMTGFFLKEKSKSSGKYPERFRGYGDALILQGSFLFVFDLILYYFQIQNTINLENFTASVSILPAMVILQATF
ncbi:MAG: hypothetical protein EH225_02070 [Calditrichaeota bacterium]|nr:MAG: hypothetical protein EH225_02070 [Calditrichota bacterium]